MDVQGWKTKTIDITFPKRDGESGMLKTIGRICQESTTAIKNGYSMIVLSDRGISSERMALSTLIAGDQCA